MISHAVHGLDDPLAGVWIDMTGIIHHVRYSGRGNACRLCNILDGDPAHGEGMLPSTQRLRNGLL